MERVGKEQVDRGREEGRKEGQKEGRREGRKEDRRKAHSERQDRQIVAIWTVEPV
jgi:flagellar biosynthesis/type III secretory pathway protein FliH